jgi:cell division protein FtsL
MRSLATRSVGERLVLAILAAAVLSIGISAARLTYRRFRIAREVDRVEAEIAALERERAALEQSRSAADDIAMIERAARELLNLKREGEKVVVLLPSSDVPKDEEQSQESPKKEGNLEKWWEYFFGVSPRK